MGHRYFRGHRWRLLIVLAAAVPAAAAAACSSGPASDGGHTAPSQPPQAALASVHVSCHDRPTDSAVLQRAIDLSPVGAAIEFQGGTCLLTKGLTLLSNRTYTGESTTGTVLQQDGGASYVLASTAYVGNATTSGEPLAIRDLTVACDGSGTTNGIVLMNWQVDVENVNVSDCGGSGIVDTNTNSAGGAITNTSVNSRFENNFISGSGHYGFAVLDSGNSVTDGFLADNQIASSGMDAIYVQNAAGWDISGNHVYDDDGNGIWAHRLFATTIGSNLIEDFGVRRPSGTWYGISGTVQDGPGSVITGNKIFNYQGERASGRYIYLGITGVNGGTGHLAVTGNVIMGVQPSDIGLSFTAGPNRLSVSVGGNEITGVGTPLSRAGQVALTGG
jgi:hypothetical protein